MELRKFVISIASKFDSRGVDKAKKSTQGLSKSVEQTEQSTSRLSSTWKRVFIGGQRIADRFRGSVQKNAAEAKRLGGAWRDANGRLRDARGRFVRLDKQVRKNSQSLDALKSGVRTAAGVFTVAAGAFALITKPVIETTAQFEQFRAQLDNLLGSADAGGAAFSQIREFTSQTPFQLAEVTSAFIKLQGRGIEPTSRTMTALGDIAAASGKSFDQVTEAALDAVVGENERLKELGIRASSVGDEVALTFRGTTVQVAKTQDAIIEALVGFGQMEGVANSMAAQMMTFNGAMSNAQDKLTEFFNTAGQSGPLEEARKILMRLGELFLEDGKNAQIFGETIALIMEDIRKELDDLDPQTIRDLFESLRSLVRILIAVRNASGSFLDVIDVTSAALNSFLETIAEISEALSGLTSDSIDTSEAMNLIAAALGIADDSAGSLISRVENLSGALGGLRDIGASAGQALVNALGQVPGLAKGISEQGKLGQAFEERGGPALQFRSTEELQAIAAGQLAAPDRVRKQAGDVLAQRTAQEQTAATQEQSAAALEAEKRRKKRGKGRKGSTFFDFEREATQAARKQAEDFAAQELERLVAQGVDSSEAIKRAAEAGRERQAELVQKFLDAGKIFEADTNNILDQLGLKGPGSVLEGRPPPQTLIISINVEINMIKEFTQTIEGLAGGAKALEEVTGQAGRAALDAGVNAEFEPTVTSVVKAILKLQGQRLLKGDGGGRLPEGPNG